MTSDPVLFDVFGHWVVSGAEKSSHGGTVAGEVFCQASARADCLH